MDVGLSTARTQVQRQQCYHCLTCKHLNTVEHYRSLVMINNRQWCWLVTNMFLPSILTLCPPKSLFSTRHHFKEQWLEQT